MYYLAVAPLAVTRRDTYTYASPRPLSPGRVVTIPYAGRNVTGVVTSDAEPVDGAKPLTDTNAELPSWQLKFARRLADQYLSPLGPTLGLFLPKWRGPNLAPERTGGAGSISLLTDPTDHIGQLGKAKGQHLVIVPEAALTKQRPDGAIRFTAAMPIAERRKAWSEARENPTAIVVGTRSALFLPWRGLGIVLVDQEDELGHLNERTPRYHAREAAGILAETHGTRLILTSAGPSLRSWTLAGKPKLPETPVNLSVEQPRFRNREDPLPYGLLEKMGELSGPTLVHCLKHRVPAVRKALAERKEVRVTGQEGLFGALRFRLVVSLDTDALLARPGYVVTERVSSLLRKLSARTAKDGRLVTYSKNPDHPAFAAATGSLNGFFQSELAEREVLRLPPTTPLIRVRTSARDLPMVRSVLEAAGVPDRAIRINATDSVALVKADPANLRGLIAPERRIGVDY